MAFLPQKLLTKKSWTSFIDALDKSAMMAALLVTLLFQMAVHSSVLAVSKTDPLSISLLGQPVNLALICGPARTDGSGSGGSAASLCQDCQPIADDPLSLIKAVSIQAPVLNNPLSFPLPDGLSHFGRDHPAYQGRGPPLFS